MSSDSVPPPPGASPPPAPAFGAPEPFPAPGAPTPGNPPPPPPPGLTAPSGYVAYNNAPTPMGALRSVKGIAKWAMGLTVLAGFASLGASLLSASVAGKAQDFLDGNITEDAFLDANAIAPLGQFLGSVPLIAAAVLSVIWMFRVASNVRALGRRTTFAPLFAIFGWVLPPILFVLPLLVLREVWKASDPNTPAGSDGWKASTENRTLYLWFLFYGVVSTALTALSVASLFDSALSLDTDTTSLAEVAAATSPTLLLAGGVVSVVSGLLWARVIQEFTARHAQFTGER